jgi:RNA-directed DNA polymerase
MDGMSIDAFPECARPHGARIRSALETGPYRPAAVLRVRIPTSTGGQRPLGIPTVLDRVLQQALAPVIRPRFEPHFRTHSDGFRAGRRARMALAEMEEAHREGLRYAIDCDRQRVFDTVNHGLLRNRLARRVNDRRVRRLMGRSRRAGGILPDGSRERTPCGGPPGSPRSPLLATGRRDARDREVERRELRCARSADDLLVFVRSQAAAQRGWRRISRVIEGRLRLRINPTKSQATRLRAGAFRGCALRGGKRHGTEAAVKRFKARVRASTPRSTGRSMPARLATLQRYGTGWLNDCGHSRRYAALVELDQWWRRRVRLCYWKQGQRPRTRRRHLLALGLSRDEVNLATRSRKGSWRMAGNSLVQRALTRPWLWDQGVPNMRQQWVELHSGAAAP